MVHDAIRWLYALERFGIKLGLGNMRALLALLEYPERSYPSILVGGTNGKGSVSAMLEGMLAAAGKTVGLYTSPHLIRPNERVRVGGRDIGDAELVSHLQAVRRVCEEGVCDGYLEAHPSFFEVITAAALGAFREARVDIAVLEVGLGGRLDATNTVDAIASVIVTVDYDHVDTLGNSLEAIAAEKAGIVKPGRPVITGVTTPVPLKLLREVCLDVGSPLIEAHRVSRLRGARGATFTVETAMALYEDLPLPLLGAHQRENARVAIVAFETIAPLLGIEPDLGIVRRGLANVRWAGRLQWVAGRPPILLDGAHNAAAAEVLATYLRTLTGHPPVMLFAAMKNKDVRGLLAPLAPHVDAIVTTRPPVDRAAEPRDLARAAMGLHPRVEATPDTASGLARARALAGPDGRVLVAGSLYLVGAVLGLLEGRAAPGPVAM